MDIASFHARRRFAETASGRIAYIEDGEGPPALFLHGVPLNGYHWRHVIDRVRHKRRCIAVDLMGLGYTEIPPMQDVSFTAQARMLAELLHALGIERPDLARERHARGEAVPLFRGYADPNVLSDEVIRLYLEPLFSSPRRIEAFGRYWLGFDNAHTVAIHDALKTLEVPTLIVWGLADFFFHRKWASWLRDNIPGARDVVEVEDARLFFPEDRPDSLTEPVLRFWDERHD
jgi:pimeloyl-ACP methyl ester carboxylesterase